jgi:glyoxylase-like metal-dependent hydrolase (beta-lactamase superfamily II)
MLQSHTPSAPTPPPRLGRGPDDRAGADQDARLAGAGSGGTARYLEAHALSVQPRRIRGDERPRGEVEHTFWSSEDRLSASPEGNEYSSARLFETNVAPLAGKMSFIRSNGEVAPGICAVEAFGHTPGHLAFHIESQGKRLLLWGDCAHHEVASLARPDWHALFDMDKGQAAATRKRIYDMAAADHLPVAGYHMSFPSLGFVDKKGAGYRWLPVSYQLNL